MNKLIRAIIFLCFISLTSACKQKEEVRVQTSVTEKNPKEYTEKEINNLIELGDHYNKVISTLGPPTIDNMIMMKETQAILGRRIMYVYKTSNDGIFNEDRDRYVSMIFDTSNLLIEEKADRVNSQLSSSLYHILSFYSLVWLGGTQPRKTSFCNT